MKKLLLIGLMTLLTNTKDKLKEYDLKGFAMLSLFMAALPAETTKNVTKTIIYQGVKLPIDVAIGLGYGVSDLSKTAYKNIRG